jgi:hypothetical protein
MVPRPNGSRISANTVRDKVNPRPMPRPSAIERTTEFLEAKTSALPKGIQLTTMRGINIPRSRYSAKKYA